MISVVMPCYNESEVLRLTYERLAEAVPTWDDTVEILLIDDGSHDDTWQIIESLARADSRVRGLRLSRNFGHQAALGAGLEQARGDVVVVLDADLQDPPELVNEMLALWRQGYDVVYAQRNRRHGETWFKKVSGNLFYRVLDRLNSVSIPRDTGDFSLMDARVAKTLIGFREQAMFWRGLRSWSGFRQTAVHFDRPPRAAGETKYTFRKLIHLASNGLLCFSGLPLRLSMYAGVAAMSLTMLAACLGLLQLVAGWPPAAWRPSGGALAMCFLGSVQLLCLGLMGEYLNRIYDEVRDRPRWIIESKCGSAEAGLADLRRKAG